LKDQIVMATNGNCAVAVPLFRYDYSDEIVSLPGYSITLARQKPLAYAVDMDDQITLFNAEFVEKHLEFLGDL